MPGLNATSTADISFILLVFFLVISSMDSNKGIQKQLPPQAKEQQKEQMEMDSRNVMDISIGLAGQIAIDGKPADKGELKQRVAQFIENCPQRSRHIVRITMLPESEYNDYFHVQDAVTAAYNSLRADYARRKFHKTPAQCSDYERRQIAAIYPQRITESVEGTGEQPAPTGKKSMEDKE